ncbi:hypothetical protein SJAV_25750 [Sulfurisphaera javensis]|uniref:Uncharacterized protein n=1 Tax=Sulfurisphaera javensis TaxID=2049879 RepID=A0AAT9GUY9_9CREN
MSEISASGFTGVFTLKVYNDPDLYAFAGRLAGLGYSVAQIKLSGGTGYLYIPLDGNGSFAKKNLIDVYYQPKTFTVVSEDVSNFVLGSGELIRALRESGVSNIDYAEINITAVRVINGLSFSFNTWNVRGITLSRGSVDDKRYEQISVTRINDQLSRYLISYYLRSDYEDISPVFHNIPQKISEIVDEIVNFYKKTFIVEKELEK